MDSVDIDTHTHTLTDLLLLRDAHDPHGLHGLQVHVSVLLSRDRHVPVGQEPVLVVSLETQFSWWTETEAEWVSCWKSWDQTGLVKHTHTHSAACLRRRSACSRTCGRLALLWLDGSRGTFPTGLTLRVKDWHTDVQWRLLTGYRATPCSANSQSESSSALASLIIHALHTVTETIISHF